MNAEYSSTIAGIVQKLETRNPLPRSLQAKSGTVNSPIELEVCH